MHDNHVTRALKEQLAHKACRLLKYSVRQLISEQSLGLAFPSLDGIFDASLTGGATNSQLGDISDLAQLGDDKKKKLASFLYKRVL